MIDVLVYILFNLHSVARLSSIGPETRTLISFDPFQHFSEFRNSRPGETGQFDSNAHWMTCSVRSGLVRRPISFDVRIAKRLPSRLRLLEFGQSTGLTLRHLEEECKHPGHFCFRISQVFGCRSVHLELRLRARFGRTDQGEKDAESRQ